VVAWNGPSRQSAVLAGFSSTSTATNSAQHSDWGGSREPKQGGMGPKKKRTKKIILSLLVLAVTDGSIMERN